MWQYNYSPENNDYLAHSELMHYGVLGMKWGVRRATYKMYSANGLAKSRKKVEKDQTKLKLKENRQKRRAAKAQMKAAKAMGNENFKKSSKYFKKSAKKQRHAQKRERTQMHNAKLLKLYDKRLNDLGSDGQVKTSKTRNAINRELANLYSASSAKASLYADSKSAYGRYSTKKSEVLGNKAKNYASKLDSSTTVDRKSPLVYSPMENRIKVQRQYVKKKSK